MKGIKENLKCAICGIPEVYKYGFCKDCYNMVKDEKIMSDSAVEEYMREKNKRKEQKQTESTDNGLYTLLDAVLLLFI